MEWYALCYGYVYQISLREIRVQLIQNIWTLFGLQITMIIAILMVTAHECGVINVRKKFNYTKWNQLEAA